MAAAADVAPETVYAVFRTKAGLLEAVVLAAVLRDDEPEGPLQRRWFRAVLKIPDVRSRIAALARHTAETKALTSPIYAVMRSAGSEPRELQQLQQRLAAYRFDGQAQMVKKIVEPSSLRPDLQPMTPQPPSPRSPARSYITCSPSIGGGPRGVTPIGWIARRRPPCSQTDRPWHQIHARCLVDAAGVWSLGLCGINHSGCRTAERCVMVQGPPAKLLVAVNTSSSLMIPFAGASGSRFRVSAQIGWTSPSGRIVKPL